MSNLCNMVGINNRNILNIWVTNISQFHKPQKLISPHRSQYYQQHTNHVDQEFPLQQRCTINWSSLMSNLCNKGGINNRNNMNSRNIIVQLLPPLQHLQPLYCTEKRWEQSQIKLQQQHQQAGKHMKFALMQQNSFCNRSILKAGSDLMY